MTGATTAHLTNCLDRRYADIARIRGEEATRLAAASHTAAIDRIGRIVRDEEIDCDFERVDGYLFAAPGTEPSTLEPELEAVRGGRDRGGIGRARSPPVFRYRKVRPVSEPGAVPPAPVPGRPRAGRARRGGRIFRSTHVDEIRGGEEARSAPVSAAIACQARSWSRPTFRSTTSSPSTPSRRAFMTLRDRRAPPEGLVPPALYWDTEDPFHYVRTPRCPTATGIVCIVGGEDHRTGQAPKEDTGDRHRRARGLGTGTLSRDRRRWPSPGRDR